VTVTNTVIVNSLFVVGSQVTNEDVNVTVALSSWVWLYSVWESCSVVACLTQIRLITVQRHGLPAAWAETSRRSTM